MIQPTTQFTVLLLLVISAFCWGSWANTFKVIKTWRFEYFYYDFTAGILLTTVIAAFTLGSMNSQDLTFQDNFLLASFRKMAWALASGLVFNLGNIFLLAATAVSGMSVAFPIALGIALVADAIWDFAYNPQASILLLFSGVFLVTIGIVMNILAYLWRQDERASAAQTPLQADPRSRNAPKRQANLAPRGVILAIVGGLALGAFFPMLSEATAGETGVSPYGVAVLISGAVFVSTLLFVPFFLFFPVLGEPGQIRGYFGGDTRQHAVGILGGALLGGGLLAGLLAAGAPRVMQPGRIAEYALDHTALLIAAVWGLLVWREFKGSSHRVRMMVVAMLVLLVAGVGMVAVAPAYGK
jgi:glucose uptake protein